jgi:hypothetical protein
MKTVYQRTIRVDSVTESPNLSAMIALFASAWSCSPLDHIAAEGVWPRPAHGW